MPVGNRRDKMFTMVVNEDENDSLDELAEHLERTKSDAVRMAVRHALDGIRRQISGDEEVHADAD